jgi:hypothetical protein
MYSRMARRVLTRSTATGPLSSPAAIDGAPQCRHAPRNRPLSSSRSRSRASRSASSTRTTRASLGSVCCTDGYPVQTRSASRSSAVVLAGSLTAFLSSAREDSNLQAQPNSYASAGSSLGTLRGRGSPSPPQADVCIEFESRRPTGRRRCSPTMTSRARTSRCSFRRGGHAAITRMSRLALATAPTGPESIFAVPTAGHRASPAGVGRDDGRPLGIPLPASVAASGDGFRRLARVHAPTLENYGPA